MNGNPKPPGGGKKKQWLLPALIVLAIVAVAGVYQLYTKLSEEGITGLLHHPARVGMVTLKNQPVYHIKKKQELLGINVIRIISKRQPEEFLVLDGVSRRLVDSIYGRHVSLSWANLVADQLTHLRATNEDGGDDVNVTIQDVKTVKLDTVPMNGRPVPRWHIQVRFKLGNEDDSRVYDALILRNLRDDHGKQDSLLVAYAQQEAFQPELLSDLMKDLDYQAN